MEVSFKGIMLGILGVFVAIIGLIFAFGSWHVVPPGHRGIVVTMGTTEPSFRGEGITAKMPLLTTIYDVPVKQLTAQGREECFSSDLQNIHVDYSVMYRMPEGKVVTLFLGYSGDPLAALITPRLSEILKAETALHRAEEIAKNRNVVKAAVLLKTQAALGGLVIIEDITLNNMKLSPDLEKAIEQKTIREQEALAKSFELDKARKDAEITVVNAEAEAKSVKIKGEALKSSPEVIALEIAKKWNGVSPTTLVTTDKGGTSLILPVK